MAEARTEHAQGFLEHAHEHAARVGLQKSPQRGTADDQDFKWMHQRHELTAGQHEPAEHASNYNDDANDFCHREETCQSLE
ncbi:hypothetical protein D9M68_969440 [compost metagenome]